MLRYLNNREAQVMSSEYVLVFFIVIGMITSMTIYFKRTLQARMRDARYSMVDTIRDRTQNYYNGTNVFRSYEPYLTESEATVSRFSRTDEELLSSAEFSSGIYRKNLNEVTYAESFVDTKPPMEAD